MSLLIHFPAVESLLNIRLVRLPTWENFASKASKTAWKKQNPENGYVFLANISELVEYKRICGAPMVQ